MRLPRFLYEREGAALTDEVPASASLAGAGSRYARNLALRVLLLAAILGGVWAPEATHYFVSTPSIRSEVIDRSRVRPADDTLRLLAPEEFPPLVQHDPSASAVRAAQALRGGWLLLDGTHRVPWSVPLQPAELTRGGPTEQLVRASMPDVQIFLDAYAESSDPQYLLAARDAVRAWSRLERRSWFQHGLLWNDHAVAMRAILLVRFWTVFRHSAQFDNDTATATLQFAARTGRMLAQPAHFAARTNHGVMQNIALLDLAAAFPELSDSATFAATGEKRLLQQLEFYVAEDGAVLEHSAGYQFFGTQLLASAARALRAVSGVHDALERKLAQARLFGDELRRPDGSLPAYGDTDLLAKVPGLLDSNAQMRRQQTLHPISGYAVLWDVSGIAPTTTSQTVVVWSNFESQAHKHADDMSTLIWTQGRTLVTNVGYWRYGDPQRLLATSWRGSNAPHLRAEAAPSAGGVQVEGYAFASDIEVLDLQRTAGSGRQFRRQLIHHAAGWWIILDRAAPPAGDAMDVVWTVAPPLQLRASGTGSYLVGDNASDFFAGVACAGEQLKVATMRASVDPFGGWVFREMTDSTPAPADSLGCSVPAGTPMATVWASGGRAAPSVQVTQWTDVEHWTVITRRNADVLQVRRSGDALEVASGDETRVLQLRRAAGPRQEVDKINVAYRRVAAEYPPWRDLLKWRSAASWVLLSALGLQELLYGGLVFALARRSVRAVALTRVHLALLTAWVLGAAWLLGSYLR